MGNQRGPGDGDSSSGSRPPLPRAAPEPERRWQDRGGLSVMKPMMPAAEPSVAPARSTGISLDPPVASVSPSRADGPVFVPNWETSASRAAAVLADAPQQTVAESNDEPPEAKPKKAKNAALRAIHDGERFGRRVVQAVGAALIVLAVSGIVAVTFSARERAAGPEVDPAINAQQRALLDQGLAERDPLKAIVAFDQVITLAPRAPATRDALVGRARRFLDINDLDAATADINMLRLRSDLGAVSRDVDALVARLKQKRP